MFVEKKKENPKNPHENCININYLFEVGLSLLDSDIADRLDETRRPNCLPSTSKAECLLHCRENSKKRCAIATALEQAEKHAQPIRMG